MDEFVNWDQAEPSSGAGVEMLSPSLLYPRDPLADIDLALANVEGDDFSFWALQHFENNVSPTMGQSDEIPMPTDRSTRRFEDHLELFEAPCVNCQLGGYQCKRIPEGEYKGHCTSCVALRCACSFGMASAFPANPWSAMGPHPAAVIQEDMHCSGHDHHSSSAPDPAEPTSAPGRDITSASEAAKAKAGVRFSRESVKILKNWLSTHSKHPYPNDEEKEILQKQTGLSKTQITNWLANTRRRNKNAVGHRSTSPGVRSFANPIDIPKRRGSASIEHMNPLQRWQHSPPENEPASVTAIARAVNASGSGISSGLNSPYSLNFTDDGSGKSLCASTVSSANTSHSHSSASVYSFGSLGSLGSQGSFGRGRRRRRRKALPATAKPPSGAPKTFQCTFCTETFRTKHDWQRHEKSLHLSLERWVCSPNGAKAFNLENGQMSCVFCGQANPDEAHIDSHNYAACQERTAPERSFYRKDHLRQHLKLVHNTKLLGWSMEQWKTTTPEIRSRCGFCDVVLDSWSIRTDHLAEHFKKGKSMADWKGGWGFEAPVLDVVENSIPPYLIHDERNSPDPYEASRPSSSSARHALELIKTELMSYMDDWREKEGKVPTDEDFQRAACALVYAAEKVSETAVSAPSWLRDLLFSSERLADEAKWTQLGGVSHRQQLEINGKRNIFELDPLEIELNEYVKARRLLGLTAMDSELQTVACSIIRRMDEVSNDPSDEITQFLTRIASSSTKWLASFRQRAHLPRSEDMRDEGKRSTDPTTIDSTIHNPSRLELELAEHVRGQLSLGIQPSDAYLQSQARIIIYEYDDGWNQTAADDPLWLLAFKQRHVLGGSPVSMSVNDNGPLPMAHMAPDAGVWAPMSQPNSTPDRRSSGSATQSSHSAGVCIGVRSASPSQTTGRYYMSDTNCYQRLARELKKWVASTMSPNNPNCHIPSDQELQHQARWIIYEDDDPWNQTPVDNAEWLRRFKRDVGLLTDPSLPGLPRGAPWTLEQGGSGFAPPYLFPNPHKATQMDPSGLLPQTDPRDNNSGSNPSADGVVQLPPPSVFCSRELERELVEFVTREVLLGGGEAGFPSDEAIRARARVFLRSGSTPADDGVLLGEFRKMMRERLGFSVEEGLPFGGNVAPVDMDLSGAMGGELGDVLQHMDFDVGNLGGFMDGFDGMVMDQL